MKLHMCKERGLCMEEATRTIEEGGYGVWVD